MRRGDGFRAGLIASLALAGAIGFGAIFANAQSGPNPGPAPTYSWTCGGSGASAGTGTYDATGGCTSGPGVPLSFLGHLNSVPAAGGVYMPPTYSSGGGGSATFNGNATDNSFIVTTSSTTSTSVVVNFGNAPSVWSTPPVCVASPDNAAAQSGGVVEVVATSAHVTLSWPTTEVSAAWNVNCLGTDVR